MIYCQSLANVSSFISFLKQSSKVSTWALEGLSNLPKVATSVDGLLTYNQCPNLVCQEYHSSIIVSLNKSKFASGSHSTELKDIAPFSWFPPERQSRVRRVSSVILLISAQAAVSCSKSSAEKELPAIPRSALVSLSCPRALFPTSERVFFLFYKCSSS